MSDDRYILVDKKPVPEPDLMKWAQWYGTAKRHVAQETIGDSRVSTVFLGLDHSFGDGGLPILWETMVFGGLLDQEMDRCAGSWEQAEAMHQAMVEKVKTK